MDLAAAGALAQVREDLGSVMLREIQIEQHEIGAREFARFDAIQQLQEPAAVPCYQQVGVDTVLIERFPDQKNVAAIVFS